MLLKNLFSFFILNIKLHLFKQYFKNIVFTIKLYISLITQITIKMTQNQKQNTLRLTHQDQQSRPIAFINSIKNIDFYTYTPIPKLSPVSTKFSKIGTYIFLIALILYLGYSIYYFFKDDTYTISTAIISNTNDGSFLMNDINLQILYYNPYNNNTQQFFNNQTILTLTLFAKVIKHPKNSNSIQILQNIKIPLTNYCGNPAKYSQKMCIQSNYLKNIPKSNYQFVNNKGQILLGINQTQDGNVTFISYSVNVEICQNQIYCLPLNQINEVINKIVVRLEFLQTISFNYVDKKLFRSAQYTLYQYNLQSSSNLEVQFIFQPTQIEITPDYITHFKSQFIQFTQMANQTHILKPFFNPTVAVFSLVPSFYQNSYRIRITTIFDALAIWFSFSKLMFGIGVLIFIGINQRKFQKKNPEWNKFDTVFNISISNQGSEMSQRKSIISYRSNTGNKVFLPQNILNDQLIQEQKSNKNPNIKNDIFPTTKRQEQ